VRIAYKCTYNFSLPILTAIFQVDLG